jgi:hypothetical protein
LAVVWWLEDEAYLVRDIFFKATFSCSMNLITILMLSTFLYIPLAGIVSHDSSFLNNTITDVLHLNRFKFRRYRGNLDRFVQQVPASKAKSYYSLEAAEDYKFKLPDPPLLKLKVSIPRRGIY